MGELDLDTGPALDGVRAALDGGVVVLACDMRCLSFIDVVGVHYLLDLARHTQSRGIAFFAYNWPRQPQQLLDLFDYLDQQGEPGRGTRAAPTRPLRRTLRSATPGRAWAPLLRDPASRPQANGG
ncbi:STAS domain-containing protein [Streptomyces goshikiensis]|uniref:STAS domain-containing protein n=1 Tax=Streptomyces goshikiensis TaxID=1942 RepID=UPI00331C1A8F